jgi:hypothetical protein
MSRLTPAPAALLLASLLLPATLARAQLATPEEINASINEGDYKGALQKIAAALSVRGEAAKKIDHYQLYMLKAECHVRTKAASMAVEAYANAAKEAPDDKSRNLAAAHELLMRKQRGMTYTPASRDKAKPAAAIDVTDPASRKKAFAALFTDELAALQPKLAAAKKATGLAPIFEAFKLIPRLEGIELAAADPKSPDPAAQAAPASAQVPPPSGAAPATPADAAPQTHKLLAELAEQSRKLIDAALRDMARRLAAIDREANQFVEISRQVPDPAVRSPFGVRMKTERAYKKKGTTDAHIKQLQDLSNTADQIAQASHMLAEGVPDQSKSFETLVTESGRIKKESERIMDADYATVYKDLPTRPKP